MLCFRKSQLNEISSRVAWAFAIETLNYVSRPAVISFHCDGLRYANYSESLIEMGGKNHHRKISEKEILISQTMFAR